MINVYENEVELSFDDGNESGYINFGVTDEGVDVDFSVGNSGEDGCGECIIKTFSRETMIDFLEEALAKLKHS